jgi:hypothetical protein
MSTAIDNFNRQLHHKIEEVEDQAKSLKESMQSSAKKTRSEIQVKLEDAKTKLNAKKQEFDEYRSKLKTQFEEKELEVKSDVEKWKEDREIQKLDHRADRAEDYAATAIVVAIASMQEAEAAIFEALSTRGDAEVAAKTKKKK